MDKVNIKLAEICDFRYKEVEFIRAGTIQVKKKAGIAKYTQTIKGIK